MRKSLFMLLEVGFALGQYFYSPSATLTSCDRTVVRPKFTLNSFDWTGREGIIDCTVTVLKSSADVCLLTVGFKAFALRSTPNCRDEHVLVNGEKICGSFLGVRQFPFNEESMALQYKGPSSALLDLDIQQTTCSPPAAAQGRTCDLESRDLVTVITSPNYPERYPSSVNCRYIILPANNNICEASLWFEEFVLQDTANCRSDKFLLGDDIFCGRLTGYRTNRNLTARLDLYFSSDSSVDDRGFRIMVEQLPCRLGTNQTETKIRTQDNYFPAYPPYVQNLPNVDCCNRPYNAPYMILTSPGFMQPDTGFEWNCLYTIRPTSPRTCRLRFHLKHFWLGEEDVFYGCTNGFLEIDGRRFCGCRDGISFVSYFNGGLKEMWYHHRGSGQRGFIIEVFQEECDLQRFPLTNSTIDPNTEIEIFTTNMTSERSMSRFLVPSDASKCYSWGLSDWGDRIKLFLLNAGVPSTCPAVSGFPPVFSASPAFPAVVPVPPIYPPVNPVPPILPIPPIYPPVNPYPPIVPVPPVYPPIPPPIYPPVTPAPPIYPPVYPVPPIYPPVTPIPPIYPPPAGCQVFASLRGSFRSPGYPSGYPPHRRCCYRIQKIPGFCHVLVSMLDFDVEWSFKCWKDYLLMDETTRFCGHSLQASATILNFRRGGYAHIDFVTDKYHSGRGFRAVFELVPCASRFAPLRSKELVAADNTTDTSILMT